MKIETVEVKIETVEVKIETVEWDVVEMIAYWGMLVVEVVVNDFVEVAQMISINLALFENPLSQLLPQASLSCLLMKVFLQLFSHFDQVNCQVYLS